jgi:hypothetical protein
MYTILGKGVTTDRQLNKVGKKLFGEQWLGVYPSDIKPHQLMKHVKQGPNYGIINVDGKNDPGSHWLSIYWNAPDDKWIIWDSFARKSKRLIPAFIKTIGYRYIDLNEKSDQKSSQDDCGARSMAVLLYIKKHGLQYATHI